METVAVSRFNDTFVRVQCSEPYVAMELDEFFTFKVPGYRFTPAYKNKLWDGTIHLFNMRKGQLYCGLVDYVRQFCEMNDYDLQIDDDVIVEDATITNDYVVNLIKSMTITSGGKPITPRDYQLLGTYYALKKRRTLLLSPTSSGKSLIIYMTIRGILDKIDNNKKILLVVPTTGLVSQMFSDFADYSEFDDGFDTASMCHKIMSGASKNSSARIFISTWQSIYKQPKTWFNQFSALLIDEAHLAKANSIKSIAEQMVSCPYKIGLTGTLDGTKTHRLVLEGLTGPVKRTIKTKELMERKQVANLSIKSVVIKYPEEIRKNARTLKYAEEVAFLEQYPKRNAFLSALAISQKKNCLMLFTKRKHGKIIYDMIKNKVGDSRPVYYITGEMDGENRNKLRNAIENHEDAIVLASYGVFSTGVSIKNIHSIIFCSSVKSEIRTLQSIGRGLRMNETKDSVVLYDIVDDLSWKSRQNYSIQHFLARHEYYSREQFDVSISSIDLI